MQVFLVLTGNIIIKNNEEGGEGGGGGKREGEESGRGVEQSKE